MDKQSIISQVVALLVFVGLCFTAAWVGSTYTRPAIETWYAGIAKPAWTPPNWLFAPVWTLLYLSMAVAGWLVWRERELGRDTAAPLALFAVQLALNALWSDIFFGMKRPGLAFLEIILLWAAILATLVAFWRVGALPGLLMLPYLLWVSFAAALNFSIWRMNS